MASETLDRLTDIGGRELDGAVTELRRNALITGLTDADIGVVFSALDALSLAVGSIPDGHNDLILAERIPTIIDPTKANVELIYRRSHGESQRLIAPITGKVYPTVRAYVQQFTTNKYPGDYEPDASLRGKPLFIEHTFPDGTATYQDAEGNTLPKDPEWPGVTKKQGAEITVQGVVRVAQARGIVVTDSPSAFEQLVRHVNSDTWLGGNARTWMCTEASYQAVSIETSPDRYLFSFEWQYRPDTWDPDIFFQDARTNAPPPGLVEGTGYKTIEYHPEYDFGALIPLLV